MHRCISLVALVAGVAIASSAVAGQLTYTSLPFPTPENRANDLAAANATQTTFLGTLSSFGTETLDEFTSGQLGATASQALTFGASGITATARFSGAFSVPALPVSTPIALVEQPATAGQPAYNNDITFNAPVTAFGSYIIQAGDVDANTITLRLENTILGTSEDVVIGTIGPGASFANVFYFGVTDTDPFNKVTMLFSNSGDGVLFDNITAGNVAVPEPSSLLLLTVGAVLPYLSWRSRRVKMGRAG
ncbi:MAG TPA: PEP-CTERM sorting domain-containing protein [Pirellulales bacterium]|jgi:hypothetical protein